MSPSGYECFWKLSPTFRSPCQGAFRSHWTEWQPLQWPHGNAPISSAILMPSPVLYGVPRTRASSQFGPR